MKLRDKIVLITGAAKGMGHVICQYLAREGADMALVARDLGKLNELAAELRAEFPARKFVTISCDVTSEPSVSAMAQAALASFGRVDVLVNTAGVIGPIETPMHEIKVEEWEHVLGVNLKGTWLCCKHLVPQMYARRSGKVVNIGGTSGLRGYVNRASYSASKWAVRGFTRTLALEAGPHNVNVNLIAPGVTHGGRMTTIINEKARKWGVTPDDVYQKYCSEMALGRFVEAEDIAAAVVYLASDDSRNITGQVLTVDGGWDV